MTRGPNGKLLVWTDVLYGGRNVFGKPKQLNVGRTGVQVLVGKAEAAAAGIPSGPDGICKEKGENEGKFERNVIAFDAAGKKVELATFSKGSDGKKVATPCSDAALASVVRLGFKLKGKGAKTKDKVAALRRFSITLTSAPAAVEEEEEEEEEEGDEDEEEGDEVNE